MYSLSTVAGRLCNKLGKKRRENEFVRLTDQEVAGVEAIVQKAFAEFKES
jgi:hypothetical protein